MKRQLTSNLTFFYKFGFPTIWTIVIIWLIGLTSLDSGVGATSFIPLILLPVIIPFIRLKAIRFDDTQIYISDGFASVTYDIDKLKSINAGHPIGFKPFWDIQLQNKNGEIIQVNFMPRLTEQIHYTFTQEYNRELGEIMELIKRR